MDGRRCNGSPVDGLRRYHRAALAAEIALSLDERGQSSSIVRAAKLVEKYDVVDTGRRGVAASIRPKIGFGWTNGVSAN